MTKMGDEPAAMRYRAEGARKFPGSAPGGRSAP
jgi:hypothetical protein